MITDEQGRQWILQKLYNEGFKYLYINTATEFCEVWASDVLPNVNEEGVVYQHPFDSNGQNSAEVELKDIITIDKPYIDIEQELGIVDWSKVPVDTPVVVWDDGDLTKKNRHFARYENDIVYAFKGGHTSWSIHDESDVIGWDNARLVDADKT